MKRTTLLLAAVALMAIASTAVATLESVTIATFDDPSTGASQPLFTVDYAAGTLTGGWAATGLTLEIPVTGGIYENATFTMTDLTFASADGYTDGGGSITFFSSANEEVLKIAFNRLWVRNRESGLDAADHRYNDGVTITGPGLPELSEEQFGFTFVNIVNGGDQFSATATFTSSAIPEPATMAILALGAMMVRKRRA